ncbi:hypothetical protein [Halalkalibacter urbisdiaboli]|uniref:hypothetical protein n=1 Tax=Halalkalibacter urbisdiaboli TaxID=1960589 RepID=UPI000B43CA32|nr:hypothetical protein [Halalkalibacter urbisdiaboli]
MIDLFFETYQECQLTNMKIVDSYPVQQWQHYIVSFSSDALPAELEDPEALIIFSEFGNVLQVVLREEGCDSPHFQFTELEKKQLTDWIQNEFT